MHFVKQKNTKLNAARCIFDSNTGTDDGDAIQAEVKMSEGGAILCS